jgi:hypothetical protein
MTPVRLEDLSKENRALMKAIVLLFYTKHQGKSCAIKSDRIVSILSTLEYEIDHRMVHLDITDAKFRALLGVIRRHNSCSKYLKKYHGIERHAFIVSSSQGYYWTEDINEMMEFWESQHGRICETMQNVHALYTLFGYSREQLQLFDWESKKEVKTKKAA